MIGNGTKQIILTCGYNTYHQLGAKSNNRSRDGTPIINPPAHLHLDASSILSYSTYFDHTVFITRSNEVLAIGDNRCGEISPTLPKRIHRQFTKFELKNNQGQLFKPTSVVCGESYTLYIVTNKAGNSKQQLAYCSHSKSDFPLFLTTGNSKIVSIFGGCTNSAAIDTDGSIYFISYTFKNSMGSQIEGSRLPGSEKAVSVACLESFIFVLSSNGSVFCSNLSKDIEKVDNTTKYRLKFNQIPELRGRKIVFISGSYNHCLAVSEDGYVFGYGSNSYGQLGCFNGQKHVSRFIQILSLGRHKITAAYAGFNHSLFKTPDGAVLACGSNAGGELFLYSAPTEECVSSPVETIIESGASFCIAGNVCSVVFKTFGGPKKDSKSQKVAPMKPLKKSVNKKRAERVRKESQSERLKRVEEENASLKAEILKLKKENIIRLIPKKK